uniref:Uncharacterized protein n=1 Tax=Ralstonia solanacearum TaxID=305 RepID=A0A0S4WYT1_RALSL|nr:conserved protein of unknown function [Ralstonia solanacearum]
MDLANGAKPTATDAKPPKVVIRCFKPRQVVTPEMKAQLRVNAAFSRRRKVPELPSGGETSPTEKVGIAGSHRGSVSSCPNGATLCERSVASHESV